MHLELTGPLHLMTNSLLNAQTNLSVTLIVFQKYILFLVIMPSSLNSLNLVHTINSDTKVVIKCKWGTVSSKCMPLPLVVDDVCRAGTYMDW